MLPVGSESLELDKIRKIGVETFVSNFISQVVNVSPGELSSIRELLEQIFVEGGRIHEQVFIVNGTEKWPALKRENLELKIICPAEEPLTLQRYLQDQFSYFKTAPRGPIEATEEQITALFKRMFGFYNIFIMK